MRVLALVTDAFGGYGGIAQYNQDFLSALASDSRIGRIHVLPRLAEDDVSIQNPKIVQHKAVFPRLRYAWAALRLLLREKPTLIFCGHLYHGLLGWMLARLGGARLISQLHGTEVWEPLSFWRIAPLRHSDMVLCVSRDTCGRYAAQAGNAGRNALVLPNTVSPAYCPGDRAAARARFGIGPERVILTVGRLDERGGYKGHDRILREMPRLIAAGRDLLYLVAGTGGDRARLEGLSRDIGIADRVRFLGKVPLDDLPDLYRAADLFALPSTGEGFGIVYLEAMACGTPAIGLDVGGVADAMADGALGACVTPDAFPQALEAALDAPRPEAETLFTAVDSRFGHDHFRHLVRDATRLVLDESRP
jgi:phosphatidyl-myo-inositol dimannoside synthase